MKNIIPAFSFVTIMLLFGCDKANNIEVPALENYWTLEEEIYRVNPAKGTAWIDGLKSIGSTSTVETVLLIQFKEKPTSPGIFVVKAYSPGGFSSLEANECAVSVVSSGGGSAFNSTGKAGEKVEITDTGDGRLRFTGTGLEARSGSKSSLLSFRVISK